jgi:hypothetical protein
MRSRLYAVFRLAAIFVALEVADLPILCGDEWGGTGPAAEMASADGAGTVVSPVSAVSAEDADCCFCPCHMTFAGTRVTAAEGLRFARDSAADPVALPLVSRPSDIDHPPQNLL